MKELRKQLTSETHHPVFHLLKEGIFQWLGGEEPTITTDLNEYPARFHDTLEKAIEDQAKIGWHNAMKGYLSTEWQHALSLAIYDNDNNQEGKGPFFTRKNQRALYNATRQLWLARNQALHGESTKDLDKIRSVETAKIKEYYKHPELIPAADRHYCERPLDTLLKKIHRPDDGGFAT